MIVQQRDVLIGELTLLVKDEQVYVLLTSYVTFYGKMYKLLYVGPSKIEIVDSFAYDVWSRTVHA